FGLFLVVNYGLAVQWQGSSQQGFHYMLIATLIVIFATRAGRTWGVDGWVRARRPGWWLARLPRGEAAERRLSFRTVLCRADALAWGSSSPRRSGGSAASVLD